VTHSRRRDEAAGSLYVPSIDAATAAAAAPEVVSVVLLPRAEDAGRRCGASRCNRVARGNNVG